MNKGEGYIYIFKCVIGKHNDICKIGKTTNLEDVSNNRLDQHVRTPYYGFIPFMDFTTGKVIATAFKVKDVNNTDNLVKDYFHEPYQISSLEVYDINYDVAIQELYNLLYDNNVFVKLIEDGVTDYSFLVLKNDVKVDTRKEVFESLRDKIFSKYNDNLPEELMKLLRDKEEYKLHCSSHYKTGNFVEFQNGYILDICVSKPSRALLLGKLQDLL